MRSSKVKTSIVQPRVSPLVVLSSSDGVEINIQLAACQESSPNVLFLHVLLWKKRSQLPESSIILMMIQSSSWASAAEDGVSNYFPAPCDTIL